MASPFVWDNTSQKSGVSSHDLPTAGRDRHHSVERPCSPRPPGLTSHSVVVSAAARGTGQAPAGAVTTIRLMNLGRLGIWWSGSWQVKDDPSVDVAREVEALGYSTLWSSGGIDPGLSPHFGRLLTATTHSAVASGIVSIGGGATRGGIARRRRPRRPVSGTVRPGPRCQPCASRRGLQPPLHAHGGLPRCTRRPRCAGPGGKDRRVLAALGPRMLALAHDRAAGAHPYFVPVEHTAAREALGKAPFSLPRSRWCSNGIRPRLARRPGRSPPVT